MSTTFTTNPVSLKTLLEACEQGKIQLPDFQRSWVWDENRIRSLIASVSRAFPVGALMTLSSRPDSPGMFASRPVEGALETASQIQPEQLLLDGQQRLTSLYQACMRKEVVRTITPKRKVVKRWFYIDIMKALGPDSDREEAIFSLPEDRKLKTNFDKDVVLDLSSPELEYQQLKYPLNRVFDWDEWQESFGDYWIAKGDPGKRETFKLFKNQVLESFKGYQIPVIALGHGTSNEAVCLVFEKVNTGGKALDAFELLTAMYAPQNQNLRNDWYGLNGQPGIQQRLATYGHVAGKAFGVLEKVASTDFLQAIALLHTAEVRGQAIAAGVKDGDLPAVRATRQSLLDLPLSAYRKYYGPVEEGFKKAGRFLRQQGIYRVVDLPYQTQMVPMAAIFAKLGDQSEHAGHQARIARWFWCGIFGEFYSSAAETRFAKDILEVPAWLEGGPDPSAVTEGIFRAERLATMRTRLSAAYKGIHALLMVEGAKDFRTGQRFDTTVFFDEYVDIHHIFPQDWCRKQRIDEKIYDTVINKTPLTFKTNRIIGGIAPSEYLAELEKGRTGKGGIIQEPPIEPEALDGFLISHGIDPRLIRADDFEAFLQARRRFLLQLISKATGHPVSEGTGASEEGEDLPLDLAQDLESEVAIA
jgi:hypothetical protein